MGRCGTHSFYEYAAAAWAEESGSVLGQTHTSRKTV